MRVRIWQEPDGSIKVTALYHGDMAQESAKLIASGALSPGAGIVWDGQEGERPPLPATKTQRFRWRWNGRAVIEDPAVPDPPTPRQGLLTAIQNAGSLAALKSVLDTAIRQGDL